MCSEWRAKYLVETNRTVGWFEPANGVGHGARPRRPLRNACGDNSMATLPITPETVKRVTLDNGIVVLLKDNPNNPSVTLRGRARRRAVR